MIIESTRIKLIDEELKVLGQQMNALRGRVNELQTAKKQPTPWYQQTSLRLVLTDMVIMKIWLANELLVTAIKQSPDIIAEKDGETTYVYLNYVNPEDEALILQSGGKIEVRPTE